MHTLGDVLHKFTVLLLLSFAATAHAGTAPRVLSLGGQLFDASGAAITSANVNFRIQIYDSTETCVLYSEDHLGEDLSVAQGHFNLILGTGTSKTNNVGTAGALDGKIFANAGATAIAGCPSSPLTLSAGQARAIHILYDLGSGYVTMTPAVPVVAAAYALVADSLNGLNESNFIQVNGTSSLNQANEEYVFSLINWPRLKALLDGTSSQYLPTTPTVPLDMNGQRITDVHDPTSAQDAATKHYVDTSLGGSAIDLTAVGPMTGGGSALLWDQAANKWVAGSVSSSPTGAAGGDLTGTYPNPTVANDKITSAKLNSTGIAVNRLIITNATDGTTLGYGACTVAGQVYAWTAGGWACATVASLSPVTSVAGKTGVVTLNAGDISGLGTSALFDWGTAPNQIVRLDGSARLPAVDGSLLTNVNAAQVQGRSVASTAPTAGQLLGWNAVSTRWEPTSVATPTSVSIATTNGILGGTITGSGTLSVDTGTAANKIVQENANAQIAQAAGLAATPAYSFAGNTGTGVYSPGANQLALATNGTAALNAAANGMIGIGTSSPGASLEVNGSALTGYATVLRLTSVGGDPGNGPFALVMGDDTQDTQKYRGFRMGITSAGDGFVYSYVANAYKNTLVNPYGGNVGIGSTTPAAVLDISAVGTTSAIIIPRDVSGNRPAGVNGMLRYNTTANAFEGFANGMWSTIAAGTAAGTITNIASGTGLLGGPIAASGTLSVNVGTAATQIVQENANAQIVQSNGSVALPSFGFAASPSSGLYSPGVNQIALVTNGTTAMTIAANGDIVMNSTTSSNNGGTGALQVRGGLGVSGQISSSANVVGANLVSYGVNTSTYASTSSSIASPATANGATAQLYNAASGDGYFTGLNLSVTNSSSKAQNAYLGVVAVTGANSNPAIVIGQQTGPSSYVERVRIDPSGNFGFGTSAPQAAFDIAGIGTASAILIPRDTTGNRPAGVNGMIRYNTTLSSFEGYANGAWGGLAAANTGPWTVNSPNISYQGGFVGIGTSSMDHVLDVWGDSSNRKLAAITDTTATAQDVGAVLELKGLDGSSDRSFAAIKGGKQNGTSGNYDGYFAVFTRSFADNGNSEKMRITAQGLMGIATTAPTAALDVAATGSASAIVVPRDSTTNRPAGVNGMIRYNTTTANFEGFQAGAWTSINTASSAMTFPLLASPGTTSAAAPSYSFGGNTAAGIFSPGANQVAIATAGSTALTVTASGSIGVGTAIPGTTLDVNGGIRPGSSAVVTTACGSATEGVQRYNYSSHALEICNGTNWLQVPLMTAGSTAPVVASGPPVSAGVYSYTLSGNYTPGFGAFANLNKSNWVADGAATYQNAGCVQLRAQTYSPVQVITIDLGSVQSVGKVYSTMAADNGLSKLGITFSVDGTSYTSSTTLAPTSGDGNYVRYVTKSLGSTVTARYIQLMNITSNDYSNGAYATFCGFAIAP